MADLKTPLALVLALGLGSAALAQDATAPAEPPAADTPAADTPAAEAPAAEPAPEAAATAEAEASDIGKPYVAQTFDAWTVQCIRTGDGKDPCQIYQLLKDSEGNSVADISIQNLPEGQKAAAGATIMTPLETDLSQNLTLKVDSAEARVYPFRFCARVGCFVQAGFTADELAALRRGNKVVVTLVPMAAPDQKVNLDMSLKGFTAAYTAMAESNARLAN